MTAQIHPVVVGTAGHIDHGKSSLVRALTGIDPDRLKEEKDRGLTIDLGFASLVTDDGRRIGMVDVPGHERFVRNMVAGSTALDLALLVVAADDGVMPQTIEHVEILELLGVGRGLVALTKTDLVDDETALLAEEEIRELLGRTRLAGAGIVRVSSTTGRGVPEIRAALQELALGTPPRSHDGPFRMSVQRAFQLKGIGTVVTGIPNTGVVSVGEEIELLPGSLRSKVRAVQAYGGAVDRAVAGHSTALSVPDVKVGKLHRGMVAAQPGIFRAGDAVDVELRVLPGAEVLRHRVPIRFHTGTVEAHGSLLVLDGDAIPGGETRVARIVLDESVCCAHGDRFLLRLQTPVRTVGGGIVLRLGGAPSRYRRQRVAAQVQRLLEAGSDPHARIQHEVTQAGAAGLSAAALAVEFAISATEAEDLLRGHEAVHWHEAGRMGFAHAEIERGRDFVLAAVERMLRDKPLAASVSRAALRTTREFPAALKDAVLDAMQRTGQVVTGADGTVLFRDRLRPLDPDERRDLERLVGACREAEFRPPSAAELAAQLAIDPTRTASLLARARDEQLVVEVDGHFYDADAIERVMRTIVQNCSRHGDVLDIPELRDALGTSRKYLIPLLEYVDGLGLTRLRGGERRLLRTSELCARLAGAAAGEAGTDPPRG